MNKRMADIDFAFRNGLKDFEVLPPPEVWDSVHHKIIRNQTPLSLMRAAALFAIVMTLSILSSRWSNKTLTESDNTLMAFRQEESAPPNSVDIALPVSVAKIGNKVNRSQQKRLAEDNTYLSRLSLNDNGVKNVTYMPETNTLLSGISTALDFVHPKKNSDFSHKNSLISYETGQEYIPEISSTKGTDRWSIAALASPTYYGKINFGSDELSRQLSASEQSIISYSGGVALSYKVNKRFSIQSGLFYSSMGQEIDGIYSFGGFQKYDYTKGDHNFEIRTTNGTVFTNNADLFLMANGNGNRIISNYSNDVFDPEKASLQYMNNTIRQNFSYLELPIILRYKIIDKTIDFNLIGGISYNLLVDNSVYTVVDGNKYAVGTTQGLNMFSISSSLGMGMEYRFSDKLSLNLEPTLRYYLNPYNNLSGSHLHPYSVGIFSGLSYKF